MTDSITPAQSIVGYRPGGRPKDDFYPTPDYAVMALLEKELFFGGSIWEPACGTGSISKVFEAEGAKVISTDLNDLGYGKPGVDFLTTEKLLAPYIVTNPPFRLAEDFVWHAMQLKADKLCLLLKLTFLEGLGRRELFKMYPPRSIYVFSKRLQLTRNGVEYRNRGMIAFAWFVWVRGYQDSPQVYWI